MKIGQWDKKLNNISSVFLFFSINLFVDLYKESEAR